MYSDFYSEIEENKMLIEFFMDTRWRLPVAILIVIVLLTGCIPKQPNWTNNDPGVDLFYDETCAPPCLLGITPGLTSEAQAKEVVARSSETFKSCTVYNYTESGGIEGILCESVSIVFDMGIVTEIGYTPKKTLTVKHLLDMYGEPDAVGAIIGTIPEVKSRVKASLYYDKFYMQILLPEQEGDRYLLEPDTRIDNIGFLIKQEYEDLRKNIDISWQGYGAYQGQLP